jgi:transcriptional regulator with XRE-family HTH domain
VSVLQIVAYNLRRAREHRGLTQAALGAELEEVTGNKWSAVTIGHAESGWGERPGRIRRFDANEIVAFAWVLQVPISWFFLPPPVLAVGLPPSSKDGAWITVREEDCELALSSNTLAALAVASPQILPVLDLYLPRLAKELPDFLPALPRRSDAKARKLAQRLRDAIEEYEQEE